MSATANDRYREALRGVLRLMADVAASTSEPAPHPVRWKRWLRRPYRKIDRVAFAHELHRRRMELR